VAKIEVELDDFLYDAAIELFQEADLGVILSEIVKQIVITYATNPEEFMRAYGAGDSIEDIQARAKIEKDGLASILRRLKQKEE